MSKILCITPNPAVDRTMVVPKLVPSAIHRSYHIVVDAGGKGINVARAVRRLRSQAVCAGFLGGLSGQRVAQLAEEEGLAGAWTWIADETRTCVIIATEDGQGATVFNENGPAVTALEWERLIDDVIAQAKQCDLLCESGSLPAGVPAESLSHLIYATKRVGAEMWVDTSGAALQAALAAGPSMIKVNADEASAIIDQPIHDAHDGVRAAIQFRTLGIQHVAITLGSDGAILATSEGTWWARPPALPIVSAVGSGDCFLAGLAVAYTNGEPLPIALKYAVAAGSANTLSPGGARFDMADFARILATVELHDLSR